MEAGRPENHVVNRFIDFFNISLFYIENTNLELFKKVLK